MQPMPNETTAKTTSSSATAEEMIKTALTRPGVKEAMEVFLRTQRVVQSCQLPANGSRPEKSASALIPSTRAVTQ